MPYVAEFAGWAGVTGDSSEGAIVRLSQDNEHVLSAVVRVTRTVITTERISSGELRERLPSLAVDLIGQYSNLDPSWVDRYSGETDVAWLISDADVLKR
jgi:hypothetical protein